MVNLDCGTWNMVIRPFKNQALSINKQRSNHVPCPNHVPNHLYMRSMGEIEKERERESNVERGRVPERGLETFSPDPLYQGVSNNGLCVCSEEFLK